MIHFTAINEIKIGDTVIKCQLRKFKSTMDMLHFISEFQCTPHQHLYIYGASDHPTGVESLGDTEFLSDYRPLLNYAVYEIEVKL